MLIFNHRIIFEEGNKNISNSISVISVKSKILLKEMSFQSDWLQMSQRSVRYHANAKENTWALEIQDVLTLVWDNRNKNIGYTKGKYFTRRLLEFWIFHTFYPLQLSLQRSHTILHVGGICLKDKAILFSAYSFGGKSTLTEYFLNQGHALLGDDTVALVKDNDRYKAIASYPFCRAYREPESLGKPIHNFVQKPLALQAMYVLKSVEKEAQIAIRTLYGIEKFKALQQSLFIEFDFLKEENFYFITDLAKYLGVYEIEIPWDLERLEEVYQAIIIHNKV